MKLGPKFDPIVNDDPQHTPVTLRAFIPPDKPGALLGKGGQVHRQIEDMFTVRLVLRREVDQYGRLCQIFGHPKRIAPAYRDALIRMYGQRPFEVDFGQDLGLEFLIPKQFADWLVDNHQLQRIHRVSNASLRLKRRCLPHTTEQVLQIYVSTLQSQCMDHFETAVRMLAFLAQKNADKVMSPYNVYHVPGQNPDEASPATIAILEHQQPDISQALPDIVYQ